MMGIAKSYIMIFSLFWTANNFPKVKLCQHHLLHPIWFSLQSIHLPLIIFYCIFHFLTSEHLAPSSGLKSQLIFIILLYKKLIFLFATFIKNLFDKILIVGIYELIQHCHAKYRNIAMNRFFPSPLVYIVFVFVEMFSKQGG